jgi:hypothetical protein
VQIAPQVGGGMHLLNFKYENSFKIKINPDPGLSGILHLSNKTINRTPQSRETIPLIIFSIGICFM